MSDNLIILSDRIKEISWTTGTSDFELSGAANGFSSFGSAYQDGDILFYAATNGINYEIGSGIFSVGLSSQSIVRMPFKSSEPNHAKVPFTDGAKEVYVTYPSTHSVYIGSGVADLNFPQSSGLAFWSSSNILNYDSEIIWDFNNKRLGIKKSYPDYAIDIGGSVNESSVQASGFYVGPSGVVFPPANDGDINYTGGSQLVHFEPNQLDNNTLIHDVIELSGTVDNIILFKRQPEGTFLAGPGSGTCSGPCADDYPIFRTINIDDIPDLSSLYVSISNLNDVSGVLRNDLTEASGLLRSDFEAGDISQNENLITASGSLRSAIDDGLNSFNINQINEEYVFSGAGTNSSVNPSINLQKGLKYIFNVDTNGYPFFIKTSPSADNLNIYNSGVANNGTDSGAILFTVPQDAPDVLYYSSSSSTTMSGVIYTSDINITSYNSYDDISSPEETDGSDTLVIWDSSDSKYKNISLQNLILAPSGNSYAKYNTISDPLSAGDVGSFAIDDYWAYFKTSEGWKRVRIQSFETTPEPTTTTTWPPDCTTPAPCSQGQVRTITDIINDGGTYDGCPIYSDCQTTTTTSTTTSTTTTTTLEPEPTYNSVFTWGYNGNFQLGFDTTRTSSSALTQINVPNIASLASSDFHSLAIDSIGRLFGWGWNSDGQLGDGTKTDIINPRVINDTIRWKMVAAGSYHSAAISIDGELYTWGGNLNGQLGNGTRISHIKPKKIGVAKNWEKVFCGTSHNIAINSLGEMFAWGSNEYGQVGNNTFEDVLVPTKIGIGYLWRTASAYMHSLCITVNGNLFAFGRNTESQLGVGQIIENEGSSGTYRLARHNTNISNPTPVSSLNIDSFYFIEDFNNISSQNVDAIALNAGIFNNWSKVSAGYQHSLAINQAGELFSFGTNNNGCLGINSPSAEAIPALIKISEERNWTDVAAGNFHSLFINSADNLFGCGKSNRGQLGPDLPPDTNSISLISSDYDWSLPVTGYDFSAAVGNVITLQTTTTTTTTVPPEISYDFISSIEEDGSLLIPDYGITILNGIPNITLRFNRAADAGFTPITCEVYRNNNLYMSINLTNGYIGSYFSIIMPDAITNYEFQIVEGRVDL
jgi:alpha-tubulin suppressor-like RCC1 family protein